MTRAEQPTVVNPTSDHLAADSRERAVRALLRFPPLRRLWTAQLVSGVGDALALLVLLLLTLHASVVQDTFGVGYRGAAFAVAAVIGVRALATLLFGAVFLGPLTRLTAPSGPLDRRWTMIGADGVRLALLIVAPLWTDWTPANAVPCLLVTVFVVGVAERVWGVCRESAAPMLLPAAPAEGAAVRPLPDNLDALRRLFLRTDFLALPLAAVVLVVVTLLNNLLGSGFGWFRLHQVALSSYVASGLFAAAVSALYFLEIPAGQSPRPRSPFEGLRRPRVGKDTDKGRTGAAPLIVFACASVAGAVAAGVALAALHAADLGGGPIGFALLVLALTGGTGAGIRLAPKVLPALSRRRLLAMALAVTGLALLASGLTPDATTVLFLVLLAGVAAGISANTGHVLLDQESEESRRARTTLHLHAVVRVFVGGGAIAAPLLAAAIGPHRLARNGFVFAHGGAAFTLMLIGALLLPVAALVLVKTDDRSGVPLRQDLRDALRGGGPDRESLAENGFFIAVEGGDGAGKSTQVEAVAEWIRAKGHEVVVTREPGATAVGKRLRSILLDVSSAGISHRAEALLYAADRAEHVDSVVRPALERGAVVISDRYIDSSVAYQGAGRDLSPTEIARISRWATGGLVPHLTVLLDISPETARERFTEAPDRLESESAEFHQRVRNGFLTLAAADSARYLVVDGGQEPEAVTAVVRHRLDQMLPLSEAEIKARDEARKAAEEAARRKAEEEAARKAEEERLERERQEELARQRAEEEERERRAMEEAREREAERQAEAARLRAEDAQRRVDEARRRREAEEKAHAAEQERLRQRAEEEARLRAEAAARRLEKQREAEEALLRAEQARLAAEAAASAAAHPDNETTVQTPMGRDSGPGHREDSAPEAGSGGDSRDADRGPAGSGPASSSGTESGRQSDRDSDSGSASGSAFGSDGGTGTNPDAEATQIMTVDPRLGAVSDSEETAVLPQLPEQGYGQSTLHPQSEVERTRELPQVEEDSGGARGRSRPRPDWAEETPLDDLPTLADELLGPREDEDGDGPGSGAEGRRP
ncbi:dTMP kinase [Streptomyces sp. TP-A0874]|uniref:dTMP kinase n=1 Tax=Streptomyces sp. TP-A0874 TaxID=549819 RepID=UPI0009A0658B|nr:dTMP kinase [Streptomyces sp. TP-A0874]